MRWTVATILLVLWLIGGITGVGGGFIHLLLIAALVILVFVRPSGRIAV